MQNTDRKIAEQAKQQQQQNGGTSTAPKTSNQNTWDKTSSAIGGVGASLGQMSNQVSDEVSDGLADRTCADIVIKTGQKISGMLAGSIPPGQLTQEAMKIFFGGFTGVSQQLTALEPATYEEDNDEELPLSASPLEIESLPKSLQTSSNGNGNNGNKS